MILTEKEKDFINNIFFSPDEIKKHTLFFGTSVGTSVSTSKQNKNSATNTNGIGKVERMNESLKRTYLENMSLAEMEYELSAIYDSLHERNLSDLVSTNIIKKIFMALPHCTFCDGLKWGFTDSVVRDEIYEFVMELELSTL